MLVKSPTIKIGTLAFLLILILAGCAVSSAPTTPEQVADTPQPMPSATPVPTLGTVEIGLRPIQVADAQVQIGVGSPIPVEVVASGTWPDLCAQVAQVEQQLSDSRFEIEILANPADP